jgi:hypothetical protein
LHGAHPTRTLGRSDNSNGLLPIRVEAFRFTLAPRSETVADSLVFREP